MAIAFALIIFGLAAIDDDLIRWLRGVLPSGEFAHQFFARLTQLGTSGWILVLSAVVAIAVGLRDLKAMPLRGRWRFANYHADASFIFFTVAVTGTLASFIKNLLGRARPKHLDTLGHQYFDFAAFESSFASFPSGHSTTFGAFAMALVLLWPKYKVLWLLFAALGGVSRMVVGAHYMSDVIAGLLFGSLLTLMAARWLAQRGTMFRFSGGILPSRNR